MHFLSYFHSWILILTMCFCSTHHQSSMNTAASQVWGVFSQIGRSEPLHHSVVGPLRDLCWRDVVLERER